MPTKTWDLSLVEVIYFVPALIPVLYCLWKHRHYGLGAWFFMASFALLQIIGNIMILSAGEHGTPSSTAIIITSVGLSPLILSIAGAVHEWCRLAGLLRTERSQKWAFVLVLLYHIAVVGAIAIYATGASQYLGSDNGSDSGKGLWESGIVLLFLLWILLCIITFLLLCRINQREMRVLYIPILTSLVLLGIRLLYQVIATFKHDSGVFNMVTGSIALRVIFEFLTSAFILLVMVVGGIMSLERVAAADEQPRAEYLMDNRRYQTGDLADPPTKFVQHPRR